MARGDALLDKTSALATWVARLLAHPWYSALMETDASNPTTKPRSELTLARKEENEQAQRLPQRVPGVRTRLAVWFRHRRAQIFWTTLVVGGAAYASTPLEFAKVMGVLASLLLVQSFAEQRANRALEEAESRSLRDKKRDVVVGVHSELSFLLESAFRLADESIWLARNPAPRAFRPDPGSEREKHIRERAAKHEGSLADFDRECRRVLGRAASFELYFPDNEKLCRAPEIAIDDIEALARAHTTTFRDQAYASAEETIAFVMREATRVLTPASLNLLSVASRSAFPKDDR